MPTDSTSTDTSSVPATVTTGGRRRRSGVSVKTLKRALKKAGLKVSGKKATLTRRAKKARLMGGADEVEEVVEETEGGRRRRSRKSKGFRLY
jgi:hypothetical protein